MKNSNHSIFAPALGGFTLIELLVVIAIIARIFWPLAATNFVLDTADDLNPSPIGWTQVPFPYPTNATDVAVTLPLPEGKNFIACASPSEARLRPSTRPHAPTRERPARLSSRRLAQRILES